MQIRESGKKVICIKTEYVPEKKRTYGRTVARQESYLSTVSEEVRQQLNDDEVDELQSWLDDREKKQNVSRLQGSLNIVRSCLPEAAEALESEVGELTEEKARQLWEGMARLQKALKKAGHLRPARQTKEKTVDKRQSKLL